MENPPFEDVFPIQRCPFSIAMFVYRRIKNPATSLAEPWIEANFFLTTFSCGHRFRSPGWERCVSGRDRCSVGVLRAGWRVSNRQMIKLHETHVFRTRNNFNREIAFWKKVRLRLQTKISGEIAFQKDVMKTSKRSTEKLPLRKCV